MSERISRYRLDDEIESPHGDARSSFWRGHDDVLDREVAIRVLDARDPRAAAFLGAARAAALVDDRRLLRILDVLELPASGGSPARIVVVSEWARGRTLTQLMADRGWEPMPVAEAVAIVDDVAHTIAAGLATNVSHGRLRPSSVIVTDVGEVRVRGLAVDAALRGSLNPALSKSQADVDGLGSLLYLLLTGTWPGHGLDLPESPRAGGHVLPPSQVTANVPRGLDDCVARSVHDAVRPRGVAKIADANGFVTVLGVARDHVSPAAATSGTPSLRAAQVLGRVGIVVIAIAAVIAIGWIGWQLITGGPSAWRPADTGETAGMLTASAAPSAPTDAIEQVLTITGVQSFDPYGDDNRNGKPDGRKGRENEDAAISVVDQNAETAWTSDRYRSPDADGKGGVGLILDLGDSKAVRSVSLDFSGAGTATQVRVADKKYRDPGTWNLLASAPAGGATIDLRAPRPIVGRYVLLWFPELPEMPDRPGRFQVSVDEVSVTG